MTYYPSIKIDIYLKNAHPSGFAEYRCSTKMSKTCKEAVEKYYATLAPSVQKQIPIERFFARFDKSNMRFD